MPKNMAGGLKSVALTPGARFIARTTIKIADAVSSVYPVFGALLVMPVTMPGKSGEWLIIAKGAKRNNFPERQGGL